MKNNKKKHSGLTKKQAQLILTADNIYFEPQPGNEDRAYMARDLVQATLPHSNPKGSPAEWYRTNGNFTLSIRPGFKTNVKTGERVCVGYPYGSIPRLLLYWMTTEVVRNGNRKLELGGTLSEFMREVGLNPRNGTGTRSDARRLKNQMDRFFRASYSFEYTAVQGGKELNRFLNMPVVSKAELWWDTKALEQATLFDSYIELSDDFFNILTASPVPLDYRVLKGLKQSPLALDLYAWVSWRSYRVSKTNKPAIVPWRELHKQIGGSYSNTADFKRKAKIALRKIAALYAGRLNISEVDGGLEIGEGSPLIAPKSVSKP